jgi:hemolysin activation/secretion protein
MIRSRLNNLTVSGTASQRRFVNKAAGTVNSDKKTETMVLGMAGDRSDLVGLAGLGAYTTYGVQLTSGAVNLDGSPDQVGDVAGAQTQGSFYKLSVQASHWMRLSKQSAWYGAVSAQFAGKNLDSSEKFVLGGVQGVRAYPSGEGAGDSGWLLNLEYRYQINTQWSAVGFFDYGSIQQRHTTYTNWNAVNPNVPNRYELTGAGVSLAWTPQLGRLILLTIAHRVNDNPARDTNGNDADGRSDATRLWIHSSLAF